MCGGLEYRIVDPETGEIIARKVFFPIPKARLPVIEETDDGENIPSVTLCRWGRRTEEDKNLDVPAGGWARLISLKEGKWNRYNPVKVKIPAVRWMEKDAQGRSHWFDLTPEQGLQGVRIEVAGERLVYVVTRPSTGLFADVHDRMPMITPIDERAKAPAPSAQGLLSLVFD